MNSSQHGLTDRLLSAIDHHASTRCGPLGAGFASPPALPAWFVPPPATSVTAAAETATGASAPTSCLRVIVIARAPSCDRDLPGLDRTRPHYTAPPVEAPHERTNV